MARSENPFDDGAVLSESATLPMHRVRDVAADAAAFLARRSQADLPVDDVTERPATRSGTEESANTADTDDTVIVSTSESLSDDQWLVLAFVLHYTRVCNLGFRGNPSLWSRDISNPSDTFYPAYTRWMNAVNESNELKARVIAIKNSFAAYVPEFTVPYRKVAHCRKEEGVCGIMDWIIANFLIDVANKSKGDLDALLLAVPITDCPDASTESVSTVAAAAAQ